MERIDALIPAELGAAVARAASGSGRAFDEQLKYVFAVCRHSTVTTSSRIAAAGEPELKEAA